MPKSLVEDYGAIHRALDMIKFVEYRSCPYLHALIAITISEEEQRWLESIRSALTRYDELAAAERTGTRHPNSKL